MTAQELINVLRENCRELGLEPENVPVFITGGLYQEKIPADIYEVTNLDLGSFRSGYQDGAGIQIILD